MLLVMILLAVSVLRSRLFMYTFDAVNAIFSLVVVYCPETFRMVLVAIRVSTNRLPVENMPPVLSIKTFDALNVDILSAAKRVVIFNSDKERLVVVKFVAVTLSAYISPVLIVLAVILPVYIYVFGVAYIFPVRYKVDAVTDDVVNTLVVTVFEKLI